MPRPPKKKESNGSAKGAIPTKEVDDPKWAGGYVVEVDPDGMRRIMPQNTLGSLDWAVMRFFESRIAFIEFVEASMQAKTNAGGKPDKKVERFVHEFWGVHKYRPRRKEMANLNEVAVRARVDPLYIFKYAANAFSLITSELLGSIMNKAMPEVMIAATTTAQIPNEIGFRDRELLFKMAGMLGETPFLNINVNTQNNISLGAASPLNQFRDVIDEIEVDVRSESYHEEEGQSEPDNNQAERPPLLLEAEGLDTARNRVDESRAWERPKTAFPRRKPVGPLRIDPLQD